MRRDEADKMVATLVSQVGCDPNRVAQSIDYWMPNLDKIDLEKAMEAIKVLMMNDTVKSKEPGKWISQIIRYCGGTTDKAKQEVNNPEVTGCPDCQNTGLIEVPSDKDWVGDRWRGEYVMVVACGCGLGQMKACQTKNLRWYESNYPNWRSEYPFRRYTWQLDGMRKRLDETMKTGDRKEIDRINSRINHLERKLNLLDQGEIDTDTSDGLNFADRLKFALRKV